MTTELERREDEAKEGKSQSNSNQELLKEELQLRQRVKAGCSENYLVAFFINSYSAILIFLFHLVSLESLLSIALSISMTIYTYNLTEDNDSFDGSVMSWTLLSFAVITPMSASIGIAFKRRELALQHLSIMKATLLSIYSAHCCWDWSKKSSPGSGRAGSSLNFTEHCDEVLEDIMDMCSTMTRMLTLPNASRGRHRATVSGMKEAKEITNVMYALHRVILKKLSTITDHCETLKREGLPPNEATRIRQWERVIYERIDLLLQIKKYRTPQALRSFARLFTVLLPPFYAPYFGQVAKDVNSLGMAIAFSVLTSLALTALFESISQIEDPFVAKLTLDGIDVEEELHEDFGKQLVCTRNHNFPDAPDFKLRDSVHSC